MADKYEKLDDANMRKVIKALEKDTPITKKAACDTLNIRYNTKRLGRLIEEYKTKVATKKRLMKKNRGKAWADIDKKYLISAYLTGSSIQDISNYLFRSTAVIKSVLRGMSIPSRDSSRGYMNPALLPEDTLLEDIPSGSIVWAARYSCIAEVLCATKGAYKLWLFGNCNQFAYQPWYELGTIPAIAELNMTHKDFEINKW